MAPPFVPVEGGLLVEVRLTPRGGRDALDGIETLADGRTVLKARVRAAPEDGKANAALLQLVAAAAGLPASRAAIVAGATARLKRIRLSGEPAALLKALSSPEIQNGRSSGRGA
jgi:uncharacterized protein YggU (UPF0235/DUF167 family)